MSEQGEVRLVAMRRNIVGHIVLLPNANTADTWDAGITEGEVQLLRPTVPTRAWRKLQTAFSTQPTTEPSP